MRRTPPIAAGTGAGAARLRVVALVVAFVAAGLLAGCGGSTSGPPGAKGTFTQNAPAAQVFGVYQGVATTSVSFTDALGQTLIRTYTTPLQIELTAPLKTSAGGQTESNPFHMSVGPLPGAIAEEGFYIIASASIATGPTETLLQPWRFDENGTAFSGTLAEPRPGATPPANVIFLPPDPTQSFTVPLTFDLAQGTRMTGSRSADHIDFRIDGNTLDGRHPFVSEVTAARLVQSLPQ